MDSPVAIMGDLDLHLFNEGRHTRLYRVMGAHPGSAPGGGAHFAVWAPNAEAVSVIGDFNGWRSGADALHPLGESGIWAGGAPGAAPGHRYKYRIRPRGQARDLDKADPFAFASEVPPATASVIASLEYEWHDQAWMGDPARGQLDAPWSVYELHIGSWRRRADGSLISYRELAPLLADYIKGMGFTHVEFLPVMEHPFYGSWGYQTLGYFAPSSRYGSPQDLMYLIDHLHQEGLGVILDWVPSHFPTDAHGLAEFDGTHLYEHADPRLGYHPDWHSAIYNYGRREVQSFLISSAMFWIDRYHADALRVDAVASMLYLDYSRQPGQWIPNRHGGRENLDAISMLQAMNTELYAANPRIQTIAEESTAWPGVTRLVSSGGLGFGMKWDMGWMHDTLEYFQQDPIHRRHHHNRLTFRSIYAFSENFMLPLSHDEVVHGKRSLAGRMPGDEWQRLANLRLLLTLMYAQPGKKLLFMGSELGQGQEWAHEQELDWNLLGEPSHAGVQRLVMDLNRIYRELPALHELDFSSQGFEWIESTDAEASVLAFLRRDRSRAQTVLAAFNFTPVPRYGVRLSTGHPGRWTEILNSDAQVYGGSGVGNLGGAETEAVPAQGREHSMLITLPPLAAVIFKGERPS